MSCWPGCRSRAGSSRSSPAHGRRARRRSRSRSWRLLASRGITSPPPRPPCRAGGGALLVLDEVQKITGWADAVKRLWDEDTAARRPLKVILLGSAPLLVQRGLTARLAGRFALVRVSHWSLAEM